MTTLTTIDEPRGSLVSWGAVIAGAIASVAVSLLLLAFGTGVGFSVISPWSGEGVSATTFKIGSLIYLIVVAMLSSTVAGMLAGRLRSRWIGVHNDEIYFRDTAHGVLAWALAPLLMARNARRGDRPTSSPARRAPSHRRRLPPREPAARTQCMSTRCSAPIRPPHPRPMPRSRRSSAPDAEATPAAAPRNANPAASRAEVGRIFTTSLHNGSMSPADRTYVAKVVAARTGISQADAEKRVDQTIADAKKAADDARKAAASFALWIAAAMLAGALSAGLAATEGGVFRDTRWYEPGWRKANARTQYMS